MPKIVHIIEATATGTLSMAALLANHQAKSGLDVSVIYSRRHETPVDFFDQFDSRVALINIQMTGLNSKLMSLPKIRKVLKKISPEKIFLHSSFAGFLGRLATVGTLPNASVFYIPHCISFMRKDIGTIKRLLFVIFEWIASIKKSDYVACSESERKLIATTIPFRKCHLVENALDLSKLPSPFQRDLVYRKKSVITVGQIRPQKGTEQFSAVARAVKTENPEVEFIWVGDGDSIARRQLEQAGVNVIGWVPKVDVWQYLNNSFIYLSTAKWEGMPVSLIEASFAGLPVIASNCAGNIDIVEHGKTGWLFQSTDEAVQYIFAALNNPKSAAEQAKRAFDVALERFNVERYVKEMDSLKQL